MTKYNLINLTDNNNYQIKSQRPLSSFYFIPVKYN